MQEINQLLVRARDQLEDLYAKKDRLEQSFIGADLRAVDKDLTSLRLTSERAQDDLTQV